MTPGIVLYCLCPCFCCDLGAGSLYVCLSFFVFRSFCFFSKDARYFALFAPSIPFAEKCYRYRKYIRHYLKTRHLPPPSFTNISLCSNITHELYLLKLMNVLLFSFSDIAVDEKMPHEAGYDSFLSGFGQWTTFSFFRRLCNILNKQDGVREGRGEFFSPFHGFLACRHLSIQHFRPTSHWMNLFNLLAALSQTFSLKITTFSLVLRIEDTGHCLGLTEQFRGWRILKCS